MEDVRTKTVLPKTDATPHKTQQSKFHYCNTILFCRLMWIENIEGKHKANWSQQSMTISVGLTSGSRKQVGLFTRIRKICVDMRIKDSQTVLFDFPSSKYFRCHCGSFNQMKTERVMKHASVIPRRWQWAPNKNWQHEPRATQIQPN